MRLPAEQEGYVLAELEDSGCHLQAIKFRSSISVTASSTYEGPRSV